MAGQQKELIAANEALVIMYIGLTRIRAALLGKSREDPYDVLADIEQTFPFREWDKLDDLIALEHNAKDDGR